MSHIGSKEAGSTRDHGSAFGSLSSPTSVRSSMADGRRMSLATPFTCVEEPLMR